MDITPEQASIVQKILNKNLPAPSKVWVFGSRTIKTKKEFSDLDLAIDSSVILPPSTIASLEYDFSESDLPYKVDLVDLNNINEIWRDRIIAEGVVFWEK